MTKTPTGPPNSYPWELFVGSSSFTVVSTASFSSAISFFATDRVTRWVMTVELSEMTFTLVVEVVEGDSSILRSSVRPLLADLRVGVAEVCCVSCWIKVSFEDFGDGGPPRFRAGDRDLERDLGLAGDLDLRRPGLRDGEDERERKRPSLCNERRSNMLPVRLT